MTRIIISEKPSMGRAIASALGIQGTGRSFIQGGDVIVTWCVGHLVTAIGPEGYDPGLKPWKLDTLPFFPEPFCYAPIEATRDQYEIVAKLITRDDVVDVVNATDAGPPCQSRGIRARVADELGFVELLGHFQRVLRRKAAPLLRC